MVRRMVRRMVRSSYDECSASVINSWSVVWRQAAAIYEWHWCHCQFPLGQYHKVGKPLGLAMGFSTDPMAIILQGMT
jgi:hypothetical protein